MNISFPVAGAQAGRTAGGGLLDKLTGGAGAGTDPAAGPKGDGSVGLFDGVLSKALIGGAVGAGIGFIPIIPGGPILGGIVGALVGAGYGMFKNFKTMKAIREENAAFIGQLGVTPPTEAHAKALVDGQPAKLLELTPEPTQGVPGQTAQQGVPGQTTQQGIPAQSTGDPAQDAAIQQAAAAEQAAAEQAAAEQRAVQQAQQQQAAQQAQQQAAQQQAQTASQAATAQAAQAPPGSTGVLTADQNPGVVLASGQGQAPPPIVDSLTQPYQSGNDAIAPKQAELAAGGASEDAAARVWSDADPAQRQAMLETLERQVQELQALLHRLQASEKRDAA